MFNWKKAQERAIKKRIAYCKTQAKAQHPDYKIRFAGECRDAGQNKFDVLTTRVTKEIKDEQALALQRRKKNV